MKSDIPHTRAALAYLGYVCQKIREECPIYYDEKLFGRLDYFVEALDDRDTLDHLPEPERIVFFRDLGDWCDEVSKTFTLIVSPGSDVIH